MNFKLKVRKLGTLPILSIAGDVTGGNIGKMTAKLEWLQKISEEKVVVDLSKATFIDSHGLGVFVFFFRRLSEENRKLIFYRPSDFIKDLFSGSNLDKIFIIADSEEML